jgi:hypothetical protein
MPNQKHQAELFGSLHVPGQPLVLFNIWDPGSAKAVAAGGTLSQSAPAGRRSRRYPGDQDRVKRCERHESYARDQQRSRDHANR